MTAVGPRQVSTPSTPPTASATASNDRRVRSRGSFRAAAAGRLVFHLPAGRHHRHRRPAVPGWHVHDQTSTPVQSNFTCRVHQRRPRYVFHTVKSNHVALTRDPARARHVRCARCGLQHHRRQKGARVPCSSLFVCARSLCSGGLLPPPLPPPSWQAGGSRTTEPQNGGLPAISGDPFVPARAVRRRPARRRPPACARAGPGETGK